VRQLGPGVGGHDGGRKGQRCALKLLGQMLHAAEHLVHRQQVADDAGGRGDDLGLTHRQHARQGVGHVRVVPCSLLPGGRVRHARIDHQGAQRGAARVQLAVAGHAGGGSRGARAREGPGAVTLADHAAQVGFAARFDASGHRGGAKALGKGHVRQRLGHGSQGKASGDRAGGVRARKLRSSGSDEGGLTPVTAHLAPQVLRAVARRPRTAPRAFPRRGRPGRFAGGRPPSRLLRGAPAPASGPGGTSPGWAS